MTCLGVGPSPCEVTVFTLPYTWSLYLVITSTCLSYLFTGNNAGTMFLTRLFIFVGLSFKVFVSADAIGESGKSPVLSDKTEHGRY